MTSTELPPPPPPPLKTFWFLRSNAVHVHTHHQDNIPQSHSDVPHQLFNHLRLGQWEMARAAILAMHASNDPNQHKLLAAALQLLAAQPQAAQW